MIHMRPAAATPACVPGLHLPPPPAPCSCARRPVSLLSVFGGTNFSFNPFQLQGAHVIASDYTLDWAGVEETTAERWCVHGWRLVLE